VHIRVMVRTTEMSVDTGAVSFVIKQEFVVFLFVYDYSGIFVMLSRVSSIEVNCILWDNVMAFDFFRRCRMVMTLYTKHLRRK
jgi:hypothetical protein